MNYLPRFHLLWLFPFAPRKSFLFCVFLSLAAIIGAAFILSSQPSLGGDWEPVPYSHDGLVLNNADRLLGLDESSPVIIRAISDQQGTLVPLHQGILLADPDQYGTYSSYNLFFKEQEQLASLLSRKKVSLILNNGQSVEVPVRPSRSLASLPLPFWMTSVVGSFCFLLSAAVWCYRRGEVTSRLLVLSGFTFFGSLLCLSIYSNRELGLDASLFRSLSIANHFFIIFFCYTLLLLFFHYPCKIGNRTITICVIVIALMIWINQSMQWYEPPVHAYFFLNHILPYAAAIILGVAQWFYTRRQPVNRAVLRWFILSIWISIGGAGASFIIPSLYGQFYIIPLWVTSIGVLVMFLFFALGTLRCGLFGLEKWWFTGWAWLLTGAVMILADLLVLSLLHINLPHLLPVSILLLGWLYFPARYWIWKMLERKGKNRIEETLPALLQTLFSSGNQQDIINKWPRMLQQIFSPLELTPLSHPIKMTAVRENGLILEVPGVDQENGWKLIAHQGGTKLFGSEEERLAFMIHRLTCTVLQATTRILSARLKGAEKERERIMRDLHDDVLPKLITLKQRSTPPLSTTADAAFQSLRDCIYLLRSKMKQPVIDVLADWRAEVADRLESLAIHLDWSQPEDDTIPPLTLSARQQVNGNRILQEIVSNILKHTRADCIHISVTVDHSLSFTVIDNGGGIQADLTRQAWQKVGARNILARIRDLGGQIQWINLPADNLSEPSGLMVSFSFPLHTVHTRGDDNA